MNREQQNKVLRAHGYIWEKVTQDWLDDNDDFETRPGWHLYAPNHRGEVSVSQAFAEIERGVDVVAKEIRVQEREKFIRESVDAELRTLRNQQAEYIKKHGERPNEKPVGEKVLNTQNIYGGGDWFVIGTDCIWYIQNNGMDGDNWSHNNVRTGGAGAIGWKISQMPDDDIVMALRGLADGTTRYRMLKNNGIGEQTP